MGWQGLSVHLVSQERLLADAPLSLSTLEDWLQVRGWEAD
jgi:hypothetical protein